MTHKEAIARIFRNQNLIIKSGLRLSLIAFLLIAITLFFAVPTFQTTILACVTSMLVLAILYLAFKLVKIYLAGLVAIPFQFYLNTLDKDPVHTIQALLFVIFSSAMLITFLIKIGITIKSKKQDDQYYLDYIAKKKRARKNDINKEAMQAAILLKQIYPATSSLLKSHSFIGGMPQLPEELSWPVTNDGRFMHFLAQIDLSTVPDAPDHLSGVTPLPDFPGQGVLYIFALCDDDLWYEEEAQFRVLYSSVNELSNRETIPPDSIQDLTRDGPIKSHDLWPLYDDDSYEGALKPRFFPRVPVELVWYISNSSHNTLAENMTALSHPKTAQIMRQGSQNQRYFLSEIVKPPEWNGSEGMSWAPCVRLVVASKILQLEAKNEKKIFSIV